MEQAIHVAKVGVNHRFGGPVVRGTDLRESSNKSEAPGIIWGLFSARHKMTPEHPRDKVDPSESNASVVGTFPTC
jgi:hypothetical protein